MENPAPQVVKNWSTPQSMTSTKKIGCRMLSTKVFRAMVRI